MTLRYQFTVQLPQLLGDPQSHVGGAGQQPGLRMGEAGGGEFGEGPGGRLLAVGAVFEAGQAQAWSSAASTACRAEVRWGWHRRREARPPAGGSQRAAQGAHRRARARWACGHSAC